ncbi:MAG: hypothetical protein LBS15_02695 [Endomicrobium sp.]|jgi:hypothetical protein|nr:hypothetical protein [Endomicrobium sp.]
MNTQKKNLFKEKDMITKEFKLRDVFYNNGIINLYQFLQIKEFDLEIALSDNSLLINFSIANEKKIYSEILNAFIKDYRIVHQTKNDRYYFDEKKLDFILDKKFDTKGGQKNDLRNGIYCYKKVSEFGLTRESVEELYINFCKENNQKPEKEPDGKLKVPNKNNEVIVAITLEEAIERFAEYFVGQADSLSIDSKIHSFEDGQESFHDMLKHPQNYKIDKWDALIYWFGCRIGNLYGSSYYIYPNSSNLKALNKFKESLKINDDDVTYRDKNEIVKSTGSNINFSEVLGKDGISAKNFYILNSAEEFEVKFFMYLFSVFYHIEERYEKANERRMERAKELHDTLKYISFTIYTDDGTFKTSLEEYTKAYWLIQFFYNIKEKDLFKYLSDMLIVFSLSQGAQENVNMRQWCQNLLNFSDLRKEYYLTSFNILKNDSRFFGKSLFEFEQVYLEFIFGGKNMDTHKDAKKVGDGVGLFCAELGNKDLLFKLRNIKNYKQLISFFKDLKFSALKNEGEAKFSKEFNDALENILSSVEENWEVARDYIAIYAIDKFRAVSFAKNNKQGE